MTVIDIMSPRAKEEKFKRIVKSREFQDLFYIKAVTGGEIKLPEDGRPILEIKNSNGKHTVRFSKIIDEFVVQVPSETEYLTLNFKDKIKVCDFFVSGKKKKIKGEK